MVEASFVFRMPEPQQVWAHHGGTRYRILGLGPNADTGDLEVGYVAVDPKPGAPIFFTRDLGKFLGFTDGKAPRFVLIEEAPSAKVLGVLSSIATDYGVVPLAPGYDWRESEDGKELVLLLGRERVGGVHVWADNRTGDVAWWTAARVANGVDHDVPGIHDSCEEAQGALLLAIRDTNFDEPAEAS